MNVDFLLNNASPQQQIKYEVKHGALDLKILEQLDKDDQEKVTYFLKLLLDKSKYKKLKEEISIRREEIIKGETLNHEEIWKNLDV